MPRSGMTAYRSMLKEVRRRRIWMKIFWPVLHEVMTTYPITFKGFAP